MNSAAPIRWTFYFCAVLLSATVLTAFFTWEDGFIPVWYGRSYCVPSSMPDHREFFWQEAFVAFVILSLMIGATLVFPFGVKMADLRPRLPEDVDLSVNSPAPIPAEPADSN